MQSLTLSNVKILPIEYMVNVDYNLQQNIDVGLQWSIKVKMKLCDHSSLHAGKFPSVLLLDSTKSAVNNTWHAVGAVIVGHRDRVKT